MINIINIIANSEWHEVIIGYRNANKMFLTHRGKVPTICGHRVRVWNVILVPTVFSFALKQLENESIVAIGVLILLEEIMEFFLLP